MDECKVGSLVVIDSEQVIGIITSRNVRNSHPNRLVVDAMTSRLISVSPDASIFDALSTMQSNGIERLIVMSGERLEGIVTRERVMASISMLIDPLTNLYRAPYIAYITEQFIKSSQPFWFLFLDMNGFGLINKRYGHVIGDQVLIHFSNQLRQLTMESDALCRFAGDEFIIVTTRSLEYARELTARLSLPFMCEQISYQAAVALFPHSDEVHPFSLTFSEVVNYTSLETTRMKKEAVSAHDHS